MFQRKGETQKKLALELLVVRTPPRYVPEFSQNFPSAMAGSRFSGSENFGFGLCELELPGRGAYKI